MPSLSKSSSIACLILFDLDTYSIGSLTFFTGDFDFFSTTAFTFSALTVFLAGEAAYLCPTFKWLSSEMISSETSSTIDSSTTDCFK